MLKITQNTLENMFREYTSKNSDIGVKKLYSLWMDAKRTREGMIQRPLTMSSSDISFLESNGFIESHGDYLKITPIGASVVNRMILKEDYCSFPLTTKNTKIASSKINVSVNWYENICRRTNLT